jgi:hypothetical protein
MVAPFTAVLLVPPSEVNLPPTNRRSPKPAAGSAPGALLSSHPP